MCVKIWGNGTKNKCSVQDCVTTSPQNSIMCPLAVASSCILSVKYIHSLQFLKSVLSRPFSRNNPFSWVFIANMYSLRLDNYLNEPTLSETLERMSSEGSGLTCIVPQSAASEMEIRTCHSILHVIRFLHYA